MKFSISIYCFIFLLSVPVFAEEIKIGCTTKCDPFYRTALKKAARDHNVEVKIFDLSRVKHKTIHDMDGVVVPGGADINPELYFPAIEPLLIEYTKSLDKFVNYSEEGRRRDPFEYKLLQDYFQNDRLSDLPLLGICRGMQMLAVSQGIPLYVDIKKELGIRNRRYLYDRVHISEQDSLMGEFFGPSLMAFKRHHQGIRVDYFEKHKIRWPHLEITSFSNRGLIAESLEFKNRPVLGVQFHPENDFGYERKRIFGWLIEKAISRKLRRSFSY
jgi:putative glutamine amidotransferase